jgi:hypothetical protein
MPSLPQGLVDGELMKAGKLETPSIEFMPLNYSLGRKKILLKYPTLWSASRNSERFLGESGDIQTRTWLAP